MMLDIVDKIGVFELLSLALNILLGSGLFVTLITLQSVRKEAGGKAQKAVAEARTDEIQNVEAAIKIWRGIAQDMAEKYDQVAAQVERLSKEVKRLNSINNRIVKLLDKITAENIEIMVDAIKQTIHENES